MIQRLFATKADRIDEAASLAMRNPLTTDASLLQAAIAAAPVAAWDNRIAATLKNGPEAVFTLAQLAGEAPLPVKS